MEYSAKMLECWYIAYYVAVFRSLSKKQHVLSGLNKTKTLSVFRYKSKMAHTAAYKVENKIPLN